MSLVRQYENLLDIVERNIEHYPEPLVILTHISEEIHDIINSGYETKFAMADTRIRLNRIVDSVKKESA